MDLDSKSSAPTPESCLSEVTPAKGKRDNDMQPVKGGQYLDLDEDANDGVVDTSQSAQTGGSNAGGGSVSVNGDQGAGLTGQNGTLTGVKYDGSDDTATEQAHHIIIPSYAAWFDYNGIHAIEKRALPEFFMGKNRSKTPEIYLAYRNFMVDAYR
jgi:SWI/SNF related-matrix-associated actin-dependent regulator of chromatin subfamily C